MPSSSLVDLRKRNWDEVGPQGPDEPAFFLSGYSDASWFDGSRRGAWACWVRGDDARVLASGPAAPWCLDPNGPELCGVSGAVRVAAVCCKGLTVGAVRPNILVIKTDSQVVATWFGWKPNGGGRRWPVQPSSAQMAELVGQTYGWAHGCGCRLIVKWVKGHQGKSSVGGFLNERVDEMCKATNCADEPAWSIWAAAVSSASRGSLFSDRRVERRESMVAHVKYCGSYGAVLEEVYGGPSGLARRPAGNVEA